MCAIDNSLTASWAVCSYLIWGCPAALFTIHVSLSETWAKMNREFALTVQKRSSRQREIKKRLGLFEIREKSR